LIVFIFQTIIGVILLLQHKIIPADIN